MKNNKEEIKEQHQIEQDEKRQHIINRGLAMARLTQNPDFIMLVEDLNEDKRSLTLSLFNESSTTMSEDRVRTRLIARVNQIDRVMQKPQQAIRLMKALKEVREVINQDKNNV